MASCNTSTQPIDITAIFSSVGANDVYEFYGEQGSGKTQCLLHLLATYILPPKWNDIVIGGKDIGVIYVDNDYHFNVLRLTVIMEQRIVNAAAVGAKGKQKVLSDDELDMFIKQCLKNLYLVRCSSNSQMIITLKSLEPILKNKSNISVLMIDSISAFYWIDRSNGAENFAAQEANLLRVCTAIEDLRERHSLTVFATKSAIFTRKAKDENEENSGRILEHCEYLCKAWQRMVSHRLIFSSSGYPSFTVKSDGAKNSSSGSKIIRTFTIDNGGLVFKA